MTAETRGILGASLFASTSTTRPLLGALDSGQLAAAILDVTDPEPLPAGHPFWRHPKLLMTPHVASYTDAEEGACAAVAAVRGHEAGGIVPGLVDRSRGY